MPQKRVEKSIDEYINDKVDYLSMVIGGSITYTILFFITFVILEIIKYTQGQIFSNPLLDNIYTYGIIPINVLILLFLCYRIQKLYKISGKAIKNKQISEKDS